MKRKFSSFFKSLVIELDKDLYGPDNHLVEWHRTPTTQETDGFQVFKQIDKKLFVFFITKFPNVAEAEAEDVFLFVNLIKVKRPGDKNVRCTILLLLDYQPLQYKLDPRLARLLGVHTQTRPVIIAALWQYIKTHRLQDAHEREYINCDKYLEQIFSCQRMKFAEIPQRLNPLLHPPDPIVINHIIRYSIYTIIQCAKKLEHLSNFHQNVKGKGEINAVIFHCSVEGTEQKKTACYDIEVEVDDTLKTQMNNFLLSTSSQQEIQVRNTLYLYVIFVLCSFHI